MNISLFKGKSRRSTVFALLTLASVVLLLVGNIFLAYFTPIKSIYFDMTSERLYSLSDAMKTETAFVDTLPAGKKIKITFCADPDALTAATVTRLTYFMALKLQQRYDNVEVETVNASLNPTALAQYKASSLTEIAPTDVIVSYGDRYRISSAAKFWMYDNNEYFSYNGEYHMVAMLKSVTAVEQPKAYFLTDHGETYFDPASPESDASREMLSFANLLRERGLDINTLNLSAVDEIPEDCVLLIINNPTKDFKTSPDEYGKLDYDSETDKIDKYLVKKQGAVMVAKDYKVELPVLEEFLAEWGIEFSTSLVKDAESSLDDELDSNTQLIADYNKDENDYTYAIYGDFAAMSSAPRTIFKDAGYVKCTFPESFAKGEDGTLNTSRNYASFLATSPYAKPYAKNSLTGEYQDLAGYAGKYDLAALVIRNNVHEVDNVDKMSYLFCTNTKEFFSNDVLGNTYYANYDIVSSLIDNISRLDIYGSSDLGGASLNSSSYGGKQLHNSVLSTEMQYVYSSDASEIIETNHAITGGMKAFIIVIVALIPVAVMIFGIAVRIKRRFL